MFDPIYEFVPHKGELFEEGGRMVHWNFSPYWYPLNNLKCYGYEDDVHGWVQPLEQRSIKVNGEDAVILKWDSSVDGTCHRIS